MIEREKENPVEIWDAEINNAEEYEMNFERLEIDLSERYIFFWTVLAYIFQCPKLIAIKYLKILYALNSKVLSIMDHY